MGNNFLVHGFRHSILSMKRCNHADWLSLSTQDNDLALQETDRLSSLTASIPDLGSQYPTLFVLIGKAAKQNALIDLLSIDGVGRSNSSIAHRRGDIRLWLAPPVFENRPIFFADGDLQENNVRSNVEPVTCHETRIRKFPQPVRGISPFTLDNIVDKMFSRLLHPFADAFCLFSADLGGFRSIAYHITRWLETGQASSLPRSTYPRLVIVTNSMVSKVQNEKKARDSFLAILSQETTKSLFEHFSGLDVVAISPRNQISSHSRHSRLKKHLMNISDQVRRGRVDTYTLFSAQHFTAFFTHASQHFTVSTVEPFDFIRATRQFNPVPRDLRQHLSNFLKYIQTSQELIDFAIPMIASSFCLASYPPDAPSKYPWSFRTSDCLLA
jgi:hypothetical protein